MSLEGIFNLADSFAVIPRVLRANQIAQGKDRIEDPFAQAPDACSTKTGVLLLIAIYAGSVLFLIAFRRLPFALLQSTKKLL